MQRKEAYGEAIERKYPQQVVIAIARDPQGKFNPITLGWAMCTSHDPPMLAISVGLTRYSLEGLLAGEEFVLAMPSAAQAEEALFYGTKSGRDVDKLAAFGAKLQPAEEIDGVLLADAVANFECRKVGQLATGDHVIFAGQVVCSHAGPEDLQRLYTVGPGYKMAGLGRQG